MLQPEILLGSEGLLSIQKEWNDIFNKANTASPFLTWQWVSTWWEKYASEIANSRLFTIVWKRDNAIVAILPLFGFTQRSSLFSLKTLRLAGTWTESSDYLDVIVDPGLKANINDLFDHPRLQDFFQDFDIFEFKNMQEDALLASYAAGGVFHSKITSVCPYIALPKDEESYIKSLSRNMRSGLKRTRNKITKHPELQFKIIEQVEQIPQAIKRLFELHNLRFDDKEQETKFVYEKRGAFHEAIAGQFQRLDALRLFTICDNNTIVGIIYCYLVKDRLMYVQAGFDPEYNKYAIGNQLLWEAINYAIRNGCSEFDFMRGNEEYKYKWTDKKRYLVSTTKAISAKGKTYVQCVNAVEAAKNSVKKLLNK